MSAKIDLKNLPAVVYVPTSRLHAAYAAGGPRDGSLYNCYTLCNRRIDATDRWCEIDRKNPYPAEGRRQLLHHCKQCQHIIDRDS